MDICLRGRRRLQVDETEPNAGGARCCMTHADAALTTSNHTVPDSFTDMHPIVVNWSSHRRNQGRNYVEAREGNSVIRPVILHVT